MTHIARVVDEPGHIAVSRRVYDSLEVDAEQVRATDSQFGVLLLPNVSHNGSYSLSDILDHHFVGSDRFQSEKTPIVNSTFRELQLLFAEL